LKGRQNEIALRIEQHQEGEGLPDHARKPDFRGFASRRHLRAFENRAKARIDRLCLFEPAPKGKKARIFIAFTLRPDGRPGRSYKREWQWRNCCRSRRMGHTTPQAIKVLNCEISDDFGLRHVPFEVAEFCEMRLDIPEGTHARRQVRAARVLARYHAALNSNGVEFIAAACASAARFAETLRLGASAVKLLTFAGNRRPDRLSQQCQLPQRLNRA
jgi:hypothetical protein